MPKQDRIPIPVQNRPDVLSSFISWWGLVNDVDTPDLILTGPYALADLESDRDDYVALEYPATDTLNTVQSLAQQRAAAEDVIRGHIVRFHKAVAGFLPGHPWDPLNEPLPTKGAAPGKFREAMREVRSLWTKINANLPAYPGFTPPLVLPGLTLAQFTSLESALVAIYDDWKQSQEAYREAIRTRDAKFLEFYPRLIQLREAVFAFLPPEHPLLFSIPALTYSGPGSTPDAPVLSGEYDPIGAEADLSWTTSESVEEISKFVLEGRLVDAMGSGGEFGELDDLSPLILATSSDFGMTSGPGFGADFRVRIVMETGNYATSNTVRVIVGEITP